MYAFTNDRPLYLQLKEQIEQAICRGELGPGSQLKSVREYAHLYRVTGNTVQRALSELDREGLTQTDRTVGRFVVADENRIKQLRETLIREQVERLIQTAQTLGVKQAELPLLVEQLCHSDTADRLDLASHPTESRGEQR